MKSYTITKVTGSPDWSTIPALEITETYRHTLEQTPVRAWTQVAYDDEALWVRQRAQEPELRAELTGVLDEICEDSCLEFFFCPLEEEPRYFNVEYNPNCCRYLGFGSGLANLTRLIPDNGVDVFHPQVTRFDGGWELTYRIPYTFIRLFAPAFDPAPGKAIRANCSKCGDKTATPHWLTWNRLPYSPAEFTFHLPEHFGRMIFG